MVKSHLSKSQRKFVRKEKARIRREFLGKKAQEEELTKVLEKLGVKKQAVDNQGGKNL